MSGMTESSPGALPVLAADLAFAAVNGGRDVADLVNWEYDAEPRVVGQRVLLARAGAVRPEAVITEVGRDGTVLLELVRASG